MRFQLPADGSTSQAQMDQLVAAIEAEINSDIDWSFIGDLDGDDLDDFHRDIAAAVLSGDHTTVERVAHDWRMATRTLSDPVALDILSGNVEDADWVDVDPVP